LFGIERSAGGILVSKRHKQSRTQNPPGQLAHKPVLATLQIAPPAKQPTLLAVSVILFALWFVFLLATALFG
jgi:hypothetical protein